MPTINRKCNFCGKEYYVCKSCERQNSWKNICCSRLCYRNLLQQENASFVPQKMSLGVNTMKIRAGLTNGNTITINGYDLELGKFDCTDGLTRSFEDFSYFIIPSAEFKMISKRLDDKIETQVVKKKNVTTKQKTIEKYFLRKYGKNFHSFRWW